MKNRAFHEKLAELVRELHDLPADDQAKIQGLAKQAQSRQEKMRRTISDLTDSLDHLRLSVKYLVFDLEATRRENAYLRRMLEKQSRGPDGLSRDE